MNQNQRQSCTQCSVLLPTLMPPNLQAATVHPNELPQWPVAPPPAAQQQSACQPGAGLPAFRLSSPSAAVGWWEHSSL